MHSPFTSELNCSYDSVRLHSTIINRSIVRKGVIMLQLTGEDAEIDPKMEFLDINFTKDSSILLHAIHSPFYWRNLKKTILFSGFKNPNKKSAKQEN